ncbi:Preprotein translocase subunit SCY1 chloroplastic, partial [Bienertia sinuspersici]
SFHLPTNILLITFFNYYYTSFQLDPNDVSEKLKLGLAVVEQVTHLTAFRGFVVTSVLIRVKCATETARKVPSISHKIYSLCLIIFVPWTHFLSEFFGINGAKIMERRNKNIDFIISTRKVLDG